MSASNPIRSCIACRTRRPQVELLRAARGEDGTVRVDAGGVPRGPGRGAYLCRDAACIERARKRGGLARALRASVSDEVWKELEARVARECPMRDRT